MNPGAFRCWDEVSFVKELYLIAKESKQGVTILFVLGHRFLTSSFCSHNNVSWTRPGCNLCSFSVSCTSICIYKCFQSDQNFTATWKLCKKKLYWLGVGWTAFLCSGRVACNGMLRQSLGGEVIFIKPVPNLFRRPRDQSNEYITSHWKILILLL